jgi:hypothetical protein
MPSPTRSTILPSLALRQTRTLQSTVRKVFSSGSVTPRPANTAEHLRDPGERAKLFEIARAYLGLARHVVERADGNSPRPSEHDARRLEDA